MSDIQATAPIMPLQPRPAWTQCIRYFSRFRSPRLRLRRRWPRWTVSLLFMGRRAGRQRGCAGHGVSGGPISFGSHAACSSSPSAKLAPRSGGGSASCISCLLCATRLSPLLQDDGRYYLEASDWRYRPLSGFWIEAGCLHVYRRDCTETLKSGIGPKRSL
jgi:hypothetical protein